MNNPQKFARLLEDSVLSTLDPHSRFCRCGRLVSKLEDLLSIKHTGVCGLCDSVERDK